MKPHLRIIAGRPVTVSAPDSAQIAAARQRFGLATGEAHRLFIHEPGTRYSRYPELVLSRWLRKATFVNVKPLTRS